MSVFIETSLGDIVIDLFVEDCPKACKNFLKLCKIKYYHNCLFHNVQRGFIVQTGDPTNTGKGGSSIYGLLYGEQARLFESEIHPHLRHAKRGMVAMASGQPDQNASQFYITTGTDLQGLDDKHTIFGVVEEGWDALDAIDRAIVDDVNHRPLRNIRIRRTEILDDPFEDPPGLESLLRDSPEPQFEFGDRLEEDWVPTTDGRSAEEIEADLERQKAANRKVVLEMIGDRPEADAKPPEDMIFVCKLNPVTTEADLETIFCRFGTITSCDIVRDKKTGDSLNYAVIGFDSKEAAEEAYLKMNNALVDDRRIKVDFSQSMFHLWKQFRRFGKQSGDASMKKAAEEHGNGGRRVLDGGRFELTTGHQHGYGAGKYSFVHAQKGPEASERSGGGHKRRRSPGGDREHSTGKDWDRDRRDRAAPSTEHRSGAPDDRRRDRDGAREERSEHGRPREERPRHESSGLRDETRSRDHREDRHFDRERRDAGSDHRHANGGEHTRSERRDAGRKERSERDEEAPRVRESDKRDRDHKAHKHKSDKKEKRSKDDKHRHRHQRSP